MINFKFTIENVLPASYLCHQSFSFSGYFFIPAQVGGLNERCGSVVSEMDGEDGGVEMVCEVTAHSATVVELNERVLYIFSI